MKKTFTMFSIAVLAFLWLGQSNAECKESRTLQFDADYAVFRIPGDTANSYVEIHYNLRRNQLKFEPLENGYEALINFKLDLKDFKGATLDSLTWKAANRIAKLSLLDDANYLISDMFGDPIPVGHYQVDLYVTNGEKQGFASFVMDVPAFKSEKPALSSIELAYQIKPDSAGRFVKNGLLVMPNPSGQYLQDAKIANVYAEAYGLDTTANADTMFHVTLQVLTLQGQSIQTHPSITYVKPSESAVIVVGFPIDTLKAGDYNLVMTLDDGADTVSASKQFSITVSHEVARKTMMQSILREFPEANNITSEEDARNFKDEISYIASPDELKLYSSLNLTGKAAFQKDFWERRNPNPLSPQNAYEIEHYRRFKYVKETFGKFKGGHAGWKTDRGRVYLIYGEPTEIERFPQTIEARSWERWWYTGLEGGVYFIFVDFENAEDYTLIHSSKRDEVKNENWEDKIKMSMNQR